MGVFSGGQALFPWCSLISSLVFEESNLLHCSSPSGRLPSGRSPTSVRGVIAKCRFSQSGARGHRVNLPPSPGSSGVRGDEGMCDTMDESRRGDRPHALSLLV